mmetsp:Transcript_62413/g.125024  ORF Transcript_62413/g.125024 Transcript_62413/m.125024 type:complete len:200 (+) Transcript_62413:329-928(+)
MDPLKRAVRRCPSGASSSSPWRVYAAAANAKHASGGTHDGVRRTRSGRASVVRLRQTSHAAIVAAALGSAGFTLDLMLSAKVLNHCSTPATVFESTIIFTAKPFRTFTTPVNTSGLLKHFSSVAIAITWGMAQKRKTWSLSKRRRYTKHSGMSVNASVTSSLRHANAWALDSGLENSPRSPLVACFFHTSCGHHALPST